MNEDPLPRIHIRAGQPISSDMLRDCWQRRELLVALVWQSTSGAYRQMALGSLWILLQPILQMVVFSVVFGAIVKVDTSGIPYPIFVFSALLPWQLFSDSAKRSTQSLVANLALITKVYFPRLFIPISTVAGVCFHFFFNLIVLAGLFVWYQCDPGLPLLLLPCFILLGAVQGLSVGLWLSCLSVKFRDINNVIGYALSLFMYATPVVYPASVVPQAWQWLYYLNPVVILIEGVRWSILGGTPPALGAVAFSLFLTLAGLVSGISLFARFEKSIVDLH